MFPLFPNYYFSRKHHKDNSKHLVVNHLSFYWGRSDLRSLCGKEISPFWSDMYRTSKAVAARKLLGILTPRVPKVPPPWTNLFSFILVQSLELLEISPLLWLQISFSIYFRSGLWFSSWWVSSCWFSNPVRGWY